MAWEITIHGTPEGQKVAGVRDANIEACYGTVGAKDILLMIEQKIVEGKPYCYYHYLLNEDIAQYSGRLGGYIGISLRTDLFSDIWYLWIARPSIPYACATSTLSTPGQWLSFQRSRYFFRIATSG